MEKAYSGLRRKRKRAHSTKCPCCYSSEEEPENHASSQKEKIKEGNKVIGKRTRRSKTVKSNEDGNDINKEVQKDNGILSEVAEGKKNETDSKKKAPKRTKQSGSKGKKVACPKQEHVDNAAEEKDLESQNKQTVRGTNKSSKTAVKKKDKTVKLSAPKHTVEENGNRNCIDGNKGSEALEKSSRAGVQSKVSKKSVDKKNSANDVTSLNKNNPEIKGKSLRKRNTGKAKTLVSSKNDGTLGLDQKGPKNENKVKNTSSGDSVSGSSSELASEKKSTSQNNRNLRRKKTPSSSESLSRKKVQVFDHLFAELKKCPGHSKATISSASELLLNLTSKELKSLIQGPGTKKLKGDMTGLRQSNDAHATSKTTMESKRKHSESEKSTIGVSVAHAIDINDNCVPSPRKIGSKKSEEAKLSQAAEALVSFRTNPSVMRQEKPEVDVQTATSLDENTAQRSLEQNPDDLLSTLLKGNQATETLMQIVSTSNEARLSQTNISSSVPPQSNLTSQLPSNLVFRGALSQPMNTPASLQQVTSAQQNIFTLSQLRSQMSAALTVPSPIQPGVTLASSVSGPSAVMSTGMIRNTGGVQNLQALFCTPPQPPSFQISTTSQPPTTCHVPGSTQQRAPLPQPLKGMEDVVSCVGSHSTALLWNIKPAPPVVYITSPQTLGGVRARNIFPNEGQGVLPFAASPAKVPSGNLQNVDSMSILGKLNRGSQPTPLSISHTASIPSQRPILPREQKVPSSFPNGLSNASQLPIAQVAGQIPGNIQPLATGSMSGGISVTSALNRQPSTTVAMQLTGVATSQSALSNTVAAMPVSAKQAVKRFVHERTKSAELKRTESFGNLPSTFDALNVPVTSSEKAENFGSALHQPLDRMEQAYASKASEFNLQQAASALLSISSQDGLDAGDVLLPAGEGDDSPEEPDDEVVFTSKGVFRVGDVDVDPKYNSIGREGYTCGKCGKIFTSLSYLARHIKRVCPDMSCRKWKCTMCDKAFRHPFGLQQHIYTHTGERPHKCSQCPKAFYSSNDLRRHSRIHSGERPYHCKHCEKSFATTISLKTHTYIHTGEKPHKCPHCPKTFATSSKLGRHIVTHSEQRPFTCNLCPKSFNRSGDLRRHNMHVHEPRDKPFEWDDCNGPFVTPDCLDMHMGNHDDRGDNQAKDRETPLQCPLCSATCDSSHRLEHHMLTHDPAIVSSHGKFNQRVDDLPGGTVSLSTDGN